MNKHVILAVLLILMFFIFTTCGAKEMFRSPEPVMGSEDTSAARVDVMEEVASPIPSAVEVTSEVKMSVPEPREMVLAGQPAAPMPSAGDETMGYYDFGKTMYL